MFAGPARVNLICIVAAGVLAVAADAAWALRIDLDPPGDRQFVLDEADLLDAKDEDAIRQQCDKLLTDKATPIIVVTITAMSEHGGDDLRIETFARLLFDQWQVGHAQLNGRNWNTGILLLVSNGDRKARIELGAGWAHDKDALARRIMDEQIIPQFKRGDFAGGIRAGVDALEAMARDKPLPTVPRPWWHYALTAGAIALTVFTIVSLYRRGASGWAWLLWAGVFSLLGFALYTLMTSRGSGGGGFSGGSFGGGFSGGGGATGSW